MPYALLDDQFHSNPKVIAMGLDGCGLYARALSYCGDYLTDGFVPLEWLTAATGRRRKLLNHLTAIGAWQQVHVKDHISYADRSGNEHQFVVHTEGVWIPDYTAFNPSKVEYYATHKRKSAAGRKGAIKRWSDSSSDTSSHSTSHSRSDGSEYGSDDGKNMARARGAGAAPSPALTREALKAEAGSRRENAEQPAPALELDPNTADPIIKLVIELRDRDNGTEHTIRTNFGHLPEAAFAYALEEIQRCRTDTDSDSGLAYTVLQRIADTGLIADTPAAGGGGNLDLEKERADPEQRRRRFVEGDGHLLPVDELEFQLGEMGAEDGELVGLLDLAADLRSSSGVAT